MITYDQLREIEARAAEATPGPWKNCGADRGGCICGLVWTIPLDTVATQARKDGVLDCKGHWLGRDDLAGTDFKADAAFVAHAREDVPALVAEVRALQAELRALRAHYDRAGPEHNLLALLDSYHERATKAEADRDRLASELQLLTAGFRPASEALLDEVARHAETRREVERLAAEVERLKRERDEVVAESASSYWHIIAREQTQRADRAEAEAAVLREERTT